MELKHLNRSTRRPFAFLIISAVVAVSFSGLIYASEYMPTFFDMDKDGDGVISTEEATYWSALERRWQDIDTDRNGMIDMREWNATDLNALSLQGTP